MNKFANIKKMALQTFMIRVRIPVVINMKKCEYCAKEISYHEMFCSDECQNASNKFYEMREKYQKPFSVINGIFVLAIGICIFLYAFTRGIGAIGASVSMLILGVMYLFLPFPPEIMIHKFKLKKAICLSRVIAGALILIAAVVLILYFTKVI